MELFHRQRQHEIDAFHFLLKKEQETYDVSNNRFLVENVELHEETDEDRTTFLLHLKRTRNMLFEPFQELYRAGIPFTTRLDFKTWYGYTNVFSIDCGFLQEGFPGYVCDAYTFQSPPEKLYKGFVWLFHTKDSDFLGMIGIRASLVQLLQGSRGIAREIVDGVVAYAIQHQKRTILVPQPLWAMRDLLKRKGFSEVQRREGDDMDPEIAFMKPVCNPNYYSKCELFQIQTSA